MGALDAVATRVAAGETVTFRPRGGSMTPLVNSGDPVTVGPVDPARVEVGDIVLVRVSGTTYLHLVSAVDHRRARVQISNNHGRVNGWTSHHRVHGLCLTVAGRPRPRTAGKQPHPGIRNRTSQSPTPATRGDFNSDPHPAW
ncbi:S24 family peptidase [Actinoplanes derwentensis]|uniref:Peptidase S24-like n=1 Tax=Actinoplanes derwentensis TaxID=113562 RepID=A0A1H1TWX5_9ACTN|nr:S24 family peptidase [Actinoplanes derwentensis]GID89877.1 hypothetical protein Ade03nite_88010 [Actinoplanes derwentensis]SDS64728.1 Peptidase S24-like [Actinoplanes derwentensis]